MAGLTSRGQSYLMPVFIIFVVLVISLITASYMLASKQSARNANNGRACTEEARVCPDGTAVGRSGPDCAFDRCPDGSEVVQATNANTANVNSSTAISSTLCAVDADCGLLICGGCFNQAYLKNAPTDLACRRYEGYSCVCRHNTCTAVNSLQTYTVADAITRAAALNETSICLSGTYQLSFETSIIFTPATGGGGRTDVWVDDVQDKSKLKCTATSDDQRDFCTAQIKLCGTFRYALPGEPGFGNQQNYRYALE